MVCPGTRGLPEEHLMWREASGCRMTRVGAVLFYVFDTTYPVRKRDETIHSPSLTLLCV